jgi:hypothetical protein
LIQHEKIGKKKKKKKKKKKNSPELVCSLSKHIREALI